MILANPASPQPCIGISGSTNLNNPPHMQHVPALLSHGGIRIMSVVTVIIKTNTMGNIAQLEPLSDHRQAPTSCARASSAAKLAATSCGVQPCLEIATSASSASLPNAGPRCSSSS
eukprot:507222-Pelagomonas_calceolata.AAC.5